MISKITKIKQFLYIGQAEWIKPKASEELWGIPYSYYEDASTPFIEIRENGIVKGTINCAAIACIEFELDSVAMEKLK